MTDAVLRFLVELKDDGLIKLEQGLLGVGKSASTMATQTAKAGVGVEASLNRIAAAERSAAQRSVTNAATRQRSLKAQAAEYRSLAATYARGSEEQVSALLLAQKAEQRLARETAIATGQIRASYAERQASATRYDLELSRIGRGAVSRSGLLGGRALAFGSAAFLGGATAAELARSVFEVSSKAEKADDSMRAQLKASHISWQQYGGEIEKVIAKDAKFAGINKRDVEGTLTDIIRTTGSLRGSYKLLGEAEDVSAGKHIKLSAAGAIVDRVFAGNLGILKRYGIVLGSNVKTPLEALIALQAKFAGQAEAQGNSTEGALEKTQQAFRSFEEGIGRGAFPVIRAELNKLTGAIDDPSLVTAGERFGHTIATNVTRALEDVVREVRDNWPEIKQDFHETADLAHQLATDLSEVARLLRSLGQLNPSGGGGAARTLIDIVGAYKLLRLASGSKTTIAKDAAGDAAKLGLAAREAKTFGGALGRIKTIAGTGLVVTIAVDYLIHKKQVDDKFDRNHLGILPDIADFFSGGNPRPILHDIAHPIAAFFKHSDPTKTTKDAVEAALPSALTDEYNRLHSVAVGTWKDVSDAIKASGGDLDANRKKLEQLLQTEQDVARQRVQLLDESFSRVTDDVGQAFDAKTQQMLDSLSYRVDVVAKGIRESFTLKGDQLTPAERELAAMDKLAQQRSLRGDLTDAERSLGQAVILGDPKAIDDAQKQVDAAQLAQRRFTLEQRAKVERAAADKARQRAQTELQARRNLEKRHLDDTLAALLKEAENGKLAGGALAGKVVDELRKHGIDFKNAGDLLGKAFSTELQQDLSTVSRRADLVGQAFGRIADTKDRIKQLVVQVKQLAKELKKAQENASNVVITAHIVGGVPKPSLVTKAGGGIIPGFGSGDTVPAMLTPGELVLNARQQQGLASQLGIAGATPDKLFAAIQKFGDGGIVRDRRRLLRLLGLDAVQNTHAALRIGRLTADGKKIPASLRRAYDPVHVEDLLRGSHLSRGDKLGLEQQLAQAQAHPVLSGLIGGKDPYNDPELGSAALTGNVRPLAGGDLAGATQGGVFNITIELDGEIVARHTQRILQRRAGR